MQNSVGFTFNRAKTDFISSLISLLCITYTCYSIAVIMRRVWMWICPRHRVKVQFNPFQMAHLLGFGQSVSPSVSPWWWFNNSSFLRMGSESTGYWHLSSPAYFPISWIFWKPNHIWQLPLPTFFMKITSFLFWKLQF